MYQSSTFIYFNSHIKLIINDCVWRTEEQSSLAEHILHRVTVIISNSNNDVSLQVAPQKKN